MGDDLNVSADTTANLNVLPENVMNILIATDVHLGYAEKDGIRGNDSFNTFEEILQMAIEYDVDMILLGGDLFHDAKPTPNCLYKCMTLLRQYILGNRPISIEFLSENVDNFQEAMSGTVNYEDPNMNVSVPIFSIHGNHDDPTGSHPLSSLDLLSANGLMNYFGKWTNYNEINISPLLFRKGATKLALYGLSYLKDERLSRLFQDKKVGMERPEDDPDSWFNIFTLHQNRAARGPKNYVPEDVLPSFLDLVVWGHEHECRVTPEHNSVNNFWVTQPGSPVATSLAAGEAIPKHVALLHIHKKHFKLVNLKLKTVRPFIFADLDLNHHSDEIDLDSVNAGKNVQEFLRIKINDMITESATHLSGHAQQPTLPLIRLRLSFHNEQHSFNAIRFGQSFSDKVANPSDMLIMKKVKTSGTKTEAGHLDKDAMKEAIRKELRISADKSVADIIERYFSEVDDSNKLLALPVKGLNEAVNCRIQKADTEAFPELIKLQENMIVDHLKKTYPSEDVIFGEILEYRQSFGDTDCQAAINMLNKRKQDAKALSIAINSSDEDNTFGAPELPTAKPARGRGSRGGRGARTTKRGAASKSSLDISTKESSNMDKNSSYISKGQPTIQGSFQRATKTSAPARKKPIAYEISSDSE